MLGYGKCRRNHAAERGGFNYDGCQEFMPSERDNERCTTCGCHRCFHCEKYFAIAMVNGVFLSTGNAAGQSRGQAHPPPAAPARPPCQVWPTSHQRTPTPSMVPWEAERHGGAPVPPLGAPERRRRRRQAKLSERQKEQMRLFAERLSWRVREQDEEELKKFCAAMGLRRNWFKLWMHKSRVAFSAPSSTVGPTNPAMQ